MKKDILRWIYLALAITEIVTVVAILLFASQVLSISKEGYDFTPILKDSGLVVALAVGALAGVTSLKLTIINGILLLNHLFEEESKK